MLYYDAFCYRLTTIYPYATILLMRLFAKIKKLSSKNKRRTLEQYQREVMVRQGREQFKKLVDSGLGMPFGIL